VNRLSLRYRIEQALDRVATALEWFQLLGVVRWLARPLLIRADLRPQPVIVVLCGGCRSTGTLNEATCVRVEHGVDLWRCGLAPVLVLSGGRRTPHRPSCAPRMKVLAERLGVPAAQMIVEDRSSRTTENAREVAQLLHDLHVSSVLLVTSPVHMRRAKLCFEKQGLAVSCAPTPGRTQGARFAREVLHEYIGLAYYRAQGWV
jgi:uncharacterized SAM-binding protein YcdF (DUF218 family)